MLYPLRFKEILRNYEFGDRWIVDVYTKEGLPENHRIAETWEVCDRGSESSVVINGALAGKTLHELIANYGIDFLGRDVVARSGTRFPLLIKFLDASNVLAEQAHHNDALAAKQGLSDPGKTEAWYMLHVRDGATIRCGNVAGATETAVHDAIMEGTIRDLMQEYAVQPGDAFLLYAGTMHYSKGGALFYEIMQNSDVYIGLTQPDATLPETEREAQVHAAMEGVHLEEGFSCKTHPVTLSEGENARTFLLACTHFVLERLDLTAPYTLECDGERFFVLSQIEGKSTVVWGTERETLRPGQTCLLPANLGTVTLEPESGPCALLKSYLPDLMQNVIQPLREAGVTDEAIVGLGGKTVLNPLKALLTL
ncbi:MAG: type I phosphomannose isomerase catalytic subunit [Anaerolineae bacterium]